MRSINRVVLLVGTFLVLLSSLAKAADVVIDNRSAFPIEVSYATEDPLEETKTFLLKKGAHRKIRFQDGERVTFWFKNTADLSTEMVSEISQELTGGSLKAVGSGLTTLVPACAMLGLSTGLLVPVGVTVAGVIAVAVKYVYDTVSTGKIIVNSSMLEQGNHYLITMKDHNKRAFACALVQKKIEEKISKKANKKRPTSPLDRNGEDNVGDDLAFAEEGPSSEFMDKPQDLDGVEGLSDDDGEEEESKSNFR